MQVMSATFLPVLVGAFDPDYDERNVLDAYIDDLSVGYSGGPQLGERLLTWEELDYLGLSRRELRHRAAMALDTMVDRVRIHGQPPTLMLSFDGLESSVLLADDFWESLRSSVPGELVVGVPARDVVIVTGSRSPNGLARVRRAVDRMFLAGGEHLLLRQLLVWNYGHWAPFDA